MLVINIRAMIALAMQVRATARRDEMTVLDCFNG